MILKASVFVEKWNIPGKSVLHYYVMLSARSSQCPRVTIDMWELHCIVHMVALKENSVLRSDQPHIMKVIEYLPGDNCVGVEQEDNWLSRTRHLLREWACKIMGSSIAPTNRTGGWKPLKRDTGNEDIFYKRTAFEFNAFNPQTLSDQLLPCGPASLNSGRPSWPPDGHFPPSELTS